MSLLDDIDEMCRSCGLEPKAKRSPQCLACRSIDRATKRAKDKEAFYASLPDIEAFRAGTDHERARVAILAIRDMMKVIKGVSPKMYEQYSYLIFKGMEN